MGLFTKKIGPVFLKETSDAEAFVEKMERLNLYAAEPLRDEIEKQIKLARYGIAGERNVAFELKNSGMDMYVLHDIYLEHGDLTAQIDYLVITRKHVYVIECKNLFGNIEIDSRGNFVRSYELEGKRVKEGVYSPVTQNERHMRVLKEIRQESKKNFLTKFLFDSGFDDNYKSIIVLANPKTYLNAKFAKKEIKEQVIRADQLISYIKTKDAAASGDMNTNTMFELAQFYLEKNQSVKADYTRKYEEILSEMEQIHDDVQDINPIPDKEEEVSQLQKISIDELTKELKTFRLKQSREEGIKPYYIFNDAQMQDLIQKMPVDKTELLNVSGFGTVKTEKYGDAILEILSRYQGP